MVESPLSGNLIFVTTAEMRAMPGRGAVYARLPPLPYTPGFDGAGVIDAVGPGVTTWKQGDRVWIAALGRSQGTYAERMLCAVDQVFALPAHVTFGAGAALGVPAATAHRALFGRAAARSGETVLVHGARSAAGLAAIQLARRHAQGVAGSRDHQALS